MRVNHDSVNMPLAARDGTTARGFVVARQLDVVDGLEVSVFKLKPATQYGVFLGGEAVGTLRTDAQGNANGTMIGPVRSFAGTGAGRPAPTARQVLILEDGTAPSAGRRCCTAE